jgi:hypothetical protein
MGGQCPALQANLNGGQKMNERRREREPATQETDPEYDKAPRGPSASAQTINPEALYRLIAVAAYYRAERRGFEPGSELEDWLNAEAEVLTEALSGKGLSS